MIIIFGRPIRIGEFLRTPIARYVPNGTQWQDTLSHDGQLIMTEIDDHLQPDIFDAIKADENVLDLIDLDPDAHPGNSRKRDRNKPTPQKGRQNAMSGAKRHSIPEELIDDAGSVDDAADVFRRKMYLDQALGGTELDEPRRAAERIMQRLRSAGIEFDIDPSDTLDKATIKALRKENWRGR